MTMLVTNQVGVFRTGKELDDAVERLRQLRTRYQDLFPSCESGPFNYALIDHLELGYLLDLSEIISRGALARTESRGGSLPAGLPST
jgi:succinate dehydrogenase / fumarate reductase, flavoprotein subunit